MADGILHDRRALVTGGAVRLGKSITLALAENGAEIVIHFNRSKSDAEKLRDEIIAGGMKAHIVQSDFNSDGEIGTLIDRANEICGPIDILVNSASIFRDEPPVELSLESLNENVRINAWTPYLLTREFARQLPDRKSGSVVNILDARIAGFDLNHSGYILSKQMMHQFTIMTAMEFAPKITVNAVAPGAILPPEGQDQMYLERMTSNLPINRPGSPVDIADAVVFLASSNYITGQVIYVDGGRHLLGN